MAPPGPTRVEYPAGGAVDLCFAMTNTTVPPLATSYLCRAFALPPGVALQATAFAPLVDQADVLHHMILYATSQDMTLAGDARGVFECASMPPVTGPVYVWAVGAPGFSLPPTVGMPVAANLGTTTGVAYAILQVHYSNPAARAGVVDSSGVLLSTTALLRPIAAGLIELGTSVAGIRVPPNRAAFGIEGQLGLLHVLHSQMGSNVLGTTRGGKQEVCMRTRQDAEAEWVVLHASGDRLATDGEPVSANDEVVLVHKMSNVALCASAAHTYPTEFGSELDVHCQTHRSTGVKSAKMTGEVASSRAEAANRWRFVLADNAAAAVDERGFTPLTGAALLARSRALVASTTGLHGLRSLALSFAAMDAKGTGVVPREAAKFALFEHGVALGVDEFALMFAPFERAAGLVAGPALLAAVRGADSFGAARAEAVHAAFAHLAAQAKGGAVTIGQAKASFDAKWDPRVTAAKPQLTAAEALLEFQRQWPLHKAAAAELTPEQFEAYYRDVSACLGDDRTFCEMVLNCWHVPGRGHWKQKKSLKVLVTLHKGSSTEAMIPAGEDLDQDNFEALCEALEKRCKIGGVARVKCLGLVEVS